MTKHRMGTVVSLTLALVLFASLGTLSSGCRRAVPQEPEPEPTETVEPTVEPEPEPVETTAVKLYFTRDEKIGVGSAQVPASSDPAALAASAVSALLEGPTAQEVEFGLGTTIPEGTQVNGVEIADGVATVDLTSTFESGGGSLSMLLRVTQVVCTLTQFEEIEKVAFMLDGEPAEAIGGEGVVVDPPVDRADFEDQLPAILVESPTPGETVSSPLTASGSSNVFEAVSQIEVADPEGAIVANQTVTATSGTGTRGTWEATIEYENAYPGRLGSIICFEYSAKDGSRINIVEIPVMME